MLTTTSSRVTKNGISFSLNLDIIELLKQEAELQGRTPSNLVNHVLGQYLTEQIKKRSTVEISDYYHG